MDDGSWRAKQLTRRTLGKGLTQIVKELSVHLTGWRSYFGFCETPSVLRDLDQWTRRRLRYRLEASRSFKSCHSDRFSDTSPHLVPHLEHV